MAAHTVLIDAAGRGRSPATIPGHLAGRAPRNKGMRYPPNPPRAEEIIAIMRQAGHDRHGLRVRALVAVLWRAGLRISEALALNETDIDEQRGSLLIHHGKADKRRQAGMDQFGFEQLAAWLAHRLLLPPGPLFCIIDGQTRGRRWSATAARVERSVASSTLVVPAFVLPTDVPSRLGSPARPAVGSGGCDDCYSRRSGDACGARLMGQFRCPARRRMTPRCRSGTA